MATYKHLRSSTANKRPTTSIADGQLAINTNTASPGLFFKDSAGTGIVKVGPVHIGTTAPNVSPAAGGSSGNYTGEQWLDTSVSPNQMKVWNGSAWVGIVADELPVSKLQDGTAGQIVQTDSAGTGVEWSSTTNLPIGSAGAPAYSFQSDSNTGIYSPGADQLAISTGGTGRLFVAANGDISLSGSQISKTSDNGVLVLHGGTSGLGANIELYGPASGNPNLAVFDADEHRFRSSSGASEKLRITSDGKVGIGTSSPTYALEVVGTTSATSSSLAQFFGINNTGTAAGVSNGLFAPAGNTLAFTTNATERARIDSSGRLLVGASSTFNSTTFEVAGSGSFGSAGNNSIGPYVITTKTRGSTVGTQSVVSSGDELGAFIFRGSDGTTYIPGGYIVAQVDGTPGTNDMPGRLVFATTADGASSSTERMRITSGGFVKASNTGLYVYDSGLFHEFSTNQNDTCGLAVKASNASLTIPVIYAETSRASNSAFSFFEGWAVADREFNLRGDGNAFADGTWTGGGADYAEYFEWVDSNPNTEDRRGISVVLEGNKIRKALSGEDPIGVISGNPSVVGDAAWNKWSGKYLRDEYGSYLLDQNGDRQLNPAYDPDAEYIPREQRPEWDCVGLMGKLRIRKGQVTGSRWIKMRDISDSVEEWLVR